MSTRCKIKSKNAGGLVALEERGFTLGDIVDDFLYSHSWADETRDKYRRTIISLLAETDPADLRAVDLARWLESKPWGDSARYVALCAVRSFLRWKYGNDHPALKLQLPRGKTQPQRVLNISEVHKVLESFDTSTPKGRRDLSMCTLFLDTGMRVSEIARLCVPNIDIQERSLTVMVKGGSWQQKVFSPYTAACMVSWLGDRAEIAKAGIANLFVGIAKFTQGNPMTRDGIKTIVTKWGKDAEVGKISPHVFRRTFATLATRNGAPQSVVMAAGGWRSETAFRRYIQSICPADIDPYSPVMSVMGL